MSSVDVVLPVYNEEHVLERSVRALHRFLTDNLAHEWRIVIADNGSTDGTPAGGRRPAGGGGGGGVDGDRVVDGHGGVPAPGERRRRSGVRRGGGDAPGPGQRDDAVAAAGGIIPRLRAAHQPPLRDAPARHAVRLQGGEPRPRPALAAAYARHGLVLGHRAAAAGVEGGLARRLRGGALADE